MICHKTLSYRQNRKYVLFGVFLIIFDQLRNYFFDCTRDHIVGYRIDRCVRIAVDRDDDGAVLHTGDVLYLSRDTAGDIELGANRDTGLADLTFVLDVSGVDRSAATVEAGFVAFESFTKRTPAASCTASSR